MQHPSPALILPAKKPLKNPAYPSFLYIYFVAREKLLAKLCVNERSLGGIINAIFTFQKGCNIEVVIIPEISPQSPLSLIIAL